MLKEEDIERMVTETVGKWGRVDYAVNAAGTDITLVIGWKAGMLTVIGVLGNNARSTETSAAQFDIISNINYRGCWLSSRAELAQMVKQEPLPSHDGRPGERGSVVNIASQLGVVGRPNARQFYKILYELGKVRRSKELTGLYIAAYCASKSAVIGMTRCDAIDVRLLLTIFCSLSLY